MRIRAKSFFTMTCSSTVYVYMARWFEDYSSCGQEWHPDLIVFDALNNYPPYTSTHASPYFFGMILTVVYRKKRRKMMVSTC